jgi:hypothetical protein
MNLCRACGLDFGSISAFDTHRVGKHAYTYSEGVLMDPVREDGRRCLSAAEIEASVNRDGSATFSPNARGVWTLTKGLVAAEALRATVTDAEKPAQRNEAA